MSDYSEKESIGQKFIIEGGIVIDRILESDNLNECVDALLRKEKQSISSI